MPEKSEIINRLIKNAAETITEEEFRTRIESGDTLTHYIGFEISGYVHLGTGIMAAHVMKDLTDLGVKCTIWLADWHSAINGKLDGTQDTAARIGQGYFTEAIKASYQAVGGKSDDLEFRLASEWYANNFPGYWRTLERVGQHTTLARVVRSMDIMGKTVGENVPYARTMYPVMQVADIFYQGIDIVHAGMDQRKIHVVMRDTAGSVAPDKPKPVALHHPLLWSLNGKDKEDKMSKSDPGSAVFIHDTPEEIEKKLKAAFAPEKEIDHNPILNWTKHLLFRSRVTPFLIERKKEHGGDVAFKEYEDLERAYAKGDVHPMDLKNAVAKELVELLAPVRDHFEQPKIVKMKRELDDVLVQK